MSTMKRTLALLATLAMASTAFVACGGGTESTESKVEDSKVEDSKVDEESKDDSAEESKDDEKTGAEVSLPSDDAVLSIVCWTDADLKNMFKNYCADKGLTEGTDIVWVQSGTSGGEAATEYATFLNSGADVDLFVAEAGWILNYINDSSFAAPLSALGITADEFSDCYDYTVAIGTNEAGDLMGASWQAAAGGFAYRTDLAKEHLGIETPEAMQDAIKDWAGFEATAEKLKTATDGKVTMTATLGGLWQCFSTATNSAWVDGGVINQATAKEFVAMAKKYGDAGYVNPAIGQWTPDWTNIGNDGSTLGYFYSTWCLAAGAQLEQNGGTAGNWNIVVGPQEYFWGGSWLCVSPNCNTADKAAEFIRYFTTDAAAMEKYALSSGDFVNNKTAMNNIVSAGSNSNALLGGQDQFAVLTEVAAGIKMNDSISAYDQSLKDTFLKSLQDNFDKSEDEIMADFVEKALAANPDLKAE